MSTQRVNNDGFAHYVLLAFLVSATLIGGAFISVQHAHNQSLAKISANNKNRISSKLQTNDQAASNLPIVTGNTSVSTPPAVADSAAANPKVAPRPSVSPTPAPKAPVPAPTSSATPPTTASGSTTPPTCSSKSCSPLETLTQLIAIIDHDGVGLDITANPVTVPGPIGNATARPIIFSYNNTVYFAYRQGQAPDFNLAAADTARSMAIVPSNTRNYTAEPAHISKTGQLVDPNSTNNLVGYSTGGN